MSSGADDMAMSSPPRSPDPFRSAITSKYRGAYSGEGEPSSRGASPSSGQPNFEQGSPHSSSRDGRHSQSPSDKRISSDGDSGLRRPKSRKGGGFLLHNMFHAAQSGGRVLLNRSAGDTKGKRKQEDHRNDFATPQKTYNLDGYSSPARSSPLSKVLLSPNARAENASISDAGNPKTPSANSRDGSKGRDTSEESNSREDVGSYSPVTAPSVAMIDPTQIVSMALNLSETRRRKVSSGQILMGSASTGRRATSSGTIGNVPTLQGGSQPPGGGSLRQYLQQQRRLSRNMSPVNAKRSASGRHLSASFGYGSYLDSANFADTGYPSSIQISPATLIRSEKAKKDLELFYTFRNLLRHLPILKTEATIPAHALSTQGVASSAAVEMSRTDSHGGATPDLGRPYNPLQLIRNRKLRARTRNPLNPDVEEWDDVLGVEAWVNAVDQASTLPNYCGLENVVLPQYPSNGQQNLHSPRSTAHRWNDSITKPKRPRTDWYTSPQELLADAYWLEQRNHKRQVEDSHGNHIRLAPPASDVFKPRLSHESRRSRNDSLARSVGSLSKDESEQENDQDEQRGRKLHLNRSHGDDGNGRLKSMLHKARGRSASLSSDLSVSDDGTKNKPARKYPTLSLDGENVGALQRHMDKILAEDLSLMDQSSPALVSPGTPDKWGRALIGPVSDQRDKRASRVDVVDFVQQPPSEVADQLDYKPRLSGERRLRPGSSFEDTDISDPSSPIAGHHVANIGLESSPPSSRLNSPARKPRKAILPFIRSDGKNDHGKADLNGPLSDEFDNQSSRNPSGETRLRPSFEVTSPIRVKQLLSHRRTDSVSSTASQPRFRAKESRDGRENASAVRRFFKGGRLGEIVRHEGAKVGEFIHVRRRDLPSESMAVDSEDSMDFLGEVDTDDDAVHKHLKPRPHQASWPANASHNHVEDSGKEDKGSLYHLSLPSFRSTLDRHENSQPNSPQADNESLKQHQRNRFAKLDRLGPSAVELSKFSSRASTAPNLSRNTTLTIESAYDRENRKGGHGFPNLLHARSNSRVRRRLQAILDIPGQASGRSSTGMPPTALSNLQAVRNSSRPSLTSKRQWSISDGLRPISPHPSASTAINPADMIRVRALLLSSGVKAAGLARKAHTQPPNGPSHFLVKAANTANKDTRMVNRDQEPILAAQLLSGSLEKDTMQLRMRERRFRETTITSMRDNIEHLRGVVESCVDHSRQLGDDAAAFSGEVNGQGTIDTRVVMDSLNKLRRSRRRRLRWARHIGFGLLEWGMLLFMWWVWLIVVVIRTILAIANGAVRVTKWVLWLN